MVQNITEALPKQNCFIVAYLFEKHGRASPSRDICRVRSEDKHDLTISSCNQWFTIKEVF